jgi:hypothetical protein
MELAAQYDDQNKTSEMTLKSDSELEALKRLNKVKRWLQDYFKTYYAGAPFCALSSLNLIFVPLIHYYGS